MRMSGRIASNASSRIPLKADEAGVLKVAPESHHHLNRSNVPAPV